jgi:hypothetical protein
VCLSGADYVQARVYERLTSHGVPSERAMGVARKVRAHYLEQARQRRAAAMAGACTIVEVRSTTTGDEETR